MENLEKPLTWGLVIVLLGYLFIANCECGEESSCPLNNGFNITNAGNYGSAFKFDALTDEDKLIAWWNKKEKSDEDITEVTAEDCDTTIATETNIDNEEVEIEEE